MSSKKRKAQCTQWGGESVEWIEGALPEFKGGTQWFLAQSGTVKHELGGSSGVVWSEKGIRQCIAESIRDGGVTWNMRGLDLCEWTMKHVHGGLFQLDDKYHSRHFYHTSEYETKVIRLAYHPNVEKIPSNPKWVAEHYIKTEVEMNERELGTVLHEYSEKFRKLDRIDNSMSYHIRELIGKIDQIIKILNQ